MFGTVAGMAAKARVQDNRKAHSQKFNEDRSDALKIAAKYLCRIGSRWDTQLQYLAGHQGSPSAVA